LFNRILSFKIAEENDDIVILFVLNNLLILLNPMVPHIAEELWEILGNEGMICNQEWPIVDKKYLQKNTIQIPIQVNGKMRSIISVPNNTSQKELEALALMEPNVEKFLNGSPKKVIVVVNRVVNFVI
jgi:leucyl-tRNA synthetase